MYQDVKVVSFRPDAVMRIVVLRQGRFKASLGPTAQRTAKKGSCVSGFVPNMLLGANSDY
jgi:hypothetical protein